MMNKQIPFNYEFLTFKQLADGSTVLASVDADKGYETVAASQTAQALGTVGAAGDFLEGVLIVPATVAPGVVKLKDGTDIEADAGAGIEAWTAPEFTVYVGGTAEPLQPIFVPVGANSKNGPWRVTTGANVSVVAVGRFS